MYGFLHFIVVDGSLLAGLLLFVTFLIALAQQSPSTAGLRERLATAPLGLGNVYAAIGGALTPFCSCSTVPVVQGMLRLGIRFGVCATFLWASPMVSEAALVVMLRHASPLHVGVFAALTIGIPIIAGIALDRMNFGRFVREEAIGEVGEVPGKVAASSPKGKAPLAVRIRLAWVFAFAEFRSTLPYLAVGLVLGGLVRGFVPAEWILGVASNVSPLTLVAIMALVGLPLYVNAVVAVPIAFELASKGLGLGPMMAFLVSGAGTSLPEMILLSKIFKKEMLGAHVTVMFLAAVTVGLVFVLMES